MECRNSDRTKRFSESVSFLHKTSFSFSVKGFQLILTDFNSYLFWQPQPRVSGASVETGMGWGRMGHQPSGGGQGQAWAELQQSRDRGQDLSSRAAPDKRDDPDQGFNSPFTKASSSAGPKPRPLNLQQQGEACSGPWHMRCNSKYPS